MRKILSIIIMLIAIVASGIAQNIVVNPQWHVGDRFIYNSTTDDSGSNLLLSFALGSSGNSKLSGKSLMTRRFAIEVMSQDADKTWHMRYTILDQQDEEPDMKDSPFAEIMKEKIGQQTYDDIIKAYEHASVAMIDSLKANSLMFSVDGNGRLLSLDNADVINRSILLAVAPAVYKLIIGLVKDEPSFADSIPTLENFQEEMIKEKMKDKGGQTMSRTMFPEIPALFSLNGLSLPVGESEGVTPLGDSIKYIVVVPEHGNVGITHTTTGASAFVELTGMDASDDSTRASLRKIFKSDTPFADSLFTDTAYDDSFYCDTDTVDYDATEYDSAYYDSAYYDSLDYVDSAFIESLPIDTASFDKVNSMMSAYVNSTVTYDEQWMPVNFDSKRLSNLLFSLKETNLVIRREKK